MICCMAVLFAHLSRCGPVLSFWLRKKTAVSDFVSITVLSIIVLKSVITPLPRINDSLDRLCWYGYFSTLDLKLNLWQIPMHEKDRKKQRLRTIKNCLN